MNGGSIEGNINNSQTPDGSAIYSNGSLDFNDVIIRNNTSEGKVMIFQGGNDFIIDFTDVEIYENTGLSNGNTGQIIMTNGGRSLYNNVIIRDNILLGDVLVDAVMYVLDGNSQLGSVFNRLQITGHEMHPALKVARIDGIDDKMTFNNCTFADNNLGSEYGWSGIDAAGYDQGASSLIINNSIFNGGNDWHISDLYLIHI